MSQDIAVIGSPEFTTGFRLAGIRRFENVPDADKDEELDAAVERVIDAENIGIIVMHEADLEYLSRDVRETVDTTIEPTVVTVGGSGTRSGLRDQIKRAIGIDLLSDSE